MTQVTKILQDATTHLPKGHVIDILHKILGSEELAKAFWMLATTDSVENQALLRTYFLTKTTGGDLKKLGLARNITTARDRFRIIAGIFRNIVLNLTS